MTSPSKEVHQFYDFYRQDGPQFRFKHPKGLGDSSRRDRDDGKMLAGTSATCCSYKHLVVDYLAPVGNLIVNTRENGSQLQAF